METRNFLFFFCLPKRRTNEKGEKMMLQRTSRPYPRRFFMPTHKEELDF
jgi:hypothetical protein